MDTPIIERLLWEEHVQKLLDLRAQIESMPLWQNPKWRQGMIDYYSRRLIEALEHEPPEVEL